MSIAEALLCQPPISPLREIAAYEALWSGTKATFKTIADLFRTNPHATPSELVQAEEIEAILPKVLAKLDEANIRDYGVRIHGSLDYPEMLRSAAHPVELLYFRGNWDLIDSPKRIAIVGSREVSEDGIKRTRHLVRGLLKEGFTIFSGLAKGVDTVAHKTAIDEGGATVAVIGTPITESYPPENKELQDYIAEYHLLVSQVPICRYFQKNDPANRFFFPERNATMSALSQATVIIEASNTSGTLTQARAALKQGRKLFILDNCFKNSELTWPKKFEEQGAIRVKNLENILQEFEI
jgi:DNA processing protein